MYYLTLSLILSRKTSFLFWFNYVYSYSTLCFLFGAGIHLDIRIIMYIMFKSLPFREHGNRFFYRCFHKKWGGVHSTYVTRLLIFCQNILVFCKWRERERERGHTAHWKLFSASGILPSVKPQFFYFLLILSHITTYNNEFNKNIKGSISSGWRVRPVYKWRQGLH